MPRCTAVVTNGMKSRRCRRSSCRDSKSCPSHPLFECTCCIEEVLRDSTTLTLHCGHVFHVTCMEKWIRHQVTSSKTCPTCRRNVCPDIVRLLSIDAPMRDIDTRMRNIVTGGAIFSAWNYGALVDLVVSAEYLVTKHYGELSSPIILSSRVETQEPQRALARVHDVIHGPQDKTRFSFVTAGKIEWVLPHGVSPLVELVNVSKIGRAIAMEYIAASTKAVEVRMEAKEYMMKRHSHRRCACYYPL